MRCPKCQYISFDSGERCRNCGYEFSLAVDEPPIEVSIGRDEPRSGRIDDLPLTSIDSFSAARPAPAHDHDVETGPSVGGRRVFTAADLPLFTERVADDQAPLITPPAVPRQPLSVRRANPRGRGPVPDELELDLEADTTKPKPAGWQRASDEALRVSAPLAASVIRRIGADLIDTCVLGAIEIGVVYLTLRACELTPDQWRVLPLFPLIAFMLMLCGGYFVLFTAAGGQTVGKMATGIRVVAAFSPGDGRLRVSFRAAMIRAVASLGSVLALGAGFLPILFSADRRAFHDRVAETRVVVA